LVCLVERLVREPSGVVKQQYQYGEFGLRVSDAMRMIQVGTIVGTFHGVCQVLICLFTNKSACLGAMNRIICTMRLGKVTRKSSNCLSPQVRM